MMTKHLGQDLRINQTCLSSTKILCFFLSPPPRNPSHLCRCPQAHVSFAAAKFLVRAFISLSSPLPLHAAKPGVPQSSKKKKRATKLLPCARRFNGMKLAELGMEGAAALLQQVRLSVRTWGNPRRQRAGLP